MRRYTDYQETGRDWLGSVPDHWRVVPLWTLYSRAKRTGFAEEELLSVYRDFGVIPKSSRDDNHNNASEDLSSYQLVEPSDLVINKMKAWQGSVGVSQHRGIVSPAYFVFEAHHNEDAVFLHYLMRSLRYITGYMTISKGIRVNQWDLEPQYHSRLPIPLPPLSEQQAVAAFLERETAKLDALVEEQQRLIELLKEKRQAVISHAVTRGLDPTAPLKPSGINWLGEIPAHWEVTRLKRISPEITVGIVVEPSKYYVEQGVPALRSLNVRPGRIEQDNLVYIGKEANETLSKSRLLAGDLVAVRTGQPGTCAVVPNDLHECNCIDLIIIRQSETFDSAYLCWFMSSDVSLRQFAEGSGGAIQQHFNVSMAQQFVVAMPPVEEQSRILSFLSEEAKKFDALTAEATRAIALLQERRAALISAAVTGKIDVRKAAAMEAA